MTNRFGSPRMRMALGAAVVLGLQVTTAGQRPYFDTPPTGSGPTPMRPYGQSGGCSEEPATFHPCAMEKAKQFTPPRTADGKPDFQGFWSRIVARNAENIQEHPEGMDGSGGKSLITDPPGGRIPYQPWAAQRGTTSNIRTRCRCYDTPPKDTERRVRSSGPARAVLAICGTWSVIPPDGRPIGRVSPVHGRPRDDGRATRVVEVTTEAWVRSTTALTGRPVVDCASHKNVVHTRRRLRAEGLYAAVDDGCRLERRPTRL